MGNLVRLEEIKCPSCGATLTIPENNTKVIKCEYCGSEFVVNMEQEQRTAPPPRPDWVPMQPIAPTQPSSAVRAVVLIIAGLAGFLVMIGFM